MPSEPNWSKHISSSNVCTWFYSLAVLNGLFAVAGVIGMLLLKKSKDLTLPLLISGSVGFINMWALFIVCNRGINTEYFEDPTKATRDWYARRHPTTIDHNINRNTDGMPSNLQQEPTAQQGSMPNLVSNRNLNPADQSINAVMQRMRESGMTEQQFNAGMAAQGPSFISNWVSANR